jgi:hypothetical protein
MLLDNIQPIQFIPDILNSFFLLFIVIFICTKLQVKKKYFIILSTSLFLPFLFYFFLHWSVLPDQSKYSDLVYNLRNFSYEHEISSLLSKVHFSSVLLSFFPIPFVSTIISVALISKGILYGIVLYFLNKKKYYFLINLLLFLPSMILISSVALRDMLIIALGIFFFYFSIEKENYLKSFLFCVLLIITKPHFAVICLTISIAYYILFVKLNFSKINKITFNILILIIIFFFTLIFFFQNNLITIRNGFYLEEFSYKLIGPIHGQLTISTVLSSFMNFLFSPLSTNQFNLINIIIFMENLFIIYLASLLLRLIYKENQFKAILWFLIWLSSFTITGFVIFNAGSIWRYKLAMQIIYLCAMYFSLKNKKIRINLL